MLFWALIFSSSLFRFGSHKALPIPFGSNVWASSWLDSNDAPILMEICEFLTLFIKP